MNLLPVVLYNALVTVPELRLFRPEPPLAEPHDWAEQQFGQADLRDGRRTRRLVHYAAQAAADPSGSVPQQTGGSWSDTKAVYTLCNNAHVTFTAVCTPHWQQTRQTPPGCYLVLGDTTEVDFGAQRDLPDACPLGNGSGRGFLLHSALVVGADTEDVVGLAGQVIRYRQPAPAGESAQQRRQRDRESAVWTAVIDQVGPPPAGVCWVHVQDRGADNFEVFCQVRQQHTECVIRASCLHRKVETAEGLRLELRELLAGLPLAGTYQLALRARPKQPARTATLEVRYGALVMPRPRALSPYARQQAPVALQVVCVQEQSPPSGSAGLRWVLYTTLPVSSYDEAVRIVTYYERRWVIEEWHKALKAGCQAERRQLRLAERLEPLLGVLGVVAVRLLQLRALARTQPQRLASECVPEEYVRVLQRLRRAKAGVNWTVAQFFAEVAKLGGFLGRKRDGEPGWQAIWDGWEKLQWVVRGVRLGRREET
jgi:hypothetical protein